MNKIDMKYFAFNDKEEYFLHGTNATLCTTGFIIVFIKNLPISGHRTVIG